MYILIWYIIYYIIEFGRFIIVALNIQNIFKLSCSLAFNRDTHSNKNVFLSHLSCYFVVFVKIEKVKKKLSVFTCRSRITKKRSSWTWFDPTYMPSEISVGRLAQRQYNRASVTHVRRWRRGGPRFSGEYILAPAVTKCARAHISAAGRCCWRGLWRTTGLSLNNWTLYTLQRQQ